MLAAAVAEFAEHGFDGAQMSAMAARAEVALGTLYSLFESKEQLFQVVVESTAESFVRALITDVTAVPGPRERLLRMIDVAFERFQTDRDFFRLYAQSTHGWSTRIRLTMGEAAQERFAAFNHFIVGLARDAADAGVLRGIDPEAFGLALMGALTNVGAAVAEGTTTRPAEELAADMRALFERLLAPEEPS